MISTSRSTLKEKIYIVVALAILIVCFLGQGHLLVPGPILSVSSRLLSQEIQNQLSVFGVLSGVKAILGSLEGSTVGFSLGASVNLELGDVVEPFYDITDTSWHVLLYALFALGAYKVFMDAKLYIIGLCGLGIGLLVVGIDRLRTGKITPLSQRAMRGAVVSGIVSYGFFFSLLGASLINQQFLAPLAQKEKLHLEEIQYQLDPLWKEITSLQDGMSILAPRESFTIAKARFEKVSGSLLRLSSDATSSLITSSILVIVQLLLFPLVLFISFKLSVRLR